MSHSGPRNDHIYICVTITIPQPHAKYRPTASTTGSDVNQTKRKIHKRLSNFVGWIKPNPAREGDIRSQADRIRISVRSEASNDGLILRSTPQAGSFAKNTGLRRHLPGGSVVEGFDVDIPFVISPKTKAQGEFQDLLRLFFRYAQAAYPNNSVELTKSSVKISFTGTRVYYDLVPMLATDDTQKQILIRSTGERIETSVQQHVEFVRSRCRSSNAEAGRVKFNECERLVKWWREFEQA